MHKGKSLSAVVSVVPVFTTDACIVAQVSVGDRPGVARCSGNAEPLCM